MISELDVSNANPNEQYFLNYFNPHLQSQYILYCPVFPNTVQIHYCLFTLVIAYLQNGDILVPVNPGPPGTMAAKTDRETVVRFLT